MDRRSTPPVGPLELDEATDGRVVDLLVVGLGITGAGVALDAAARGLDVVAVDAHDLAFGTSRWSSKLAHGGLRYLARGQVGVAAESAVERRILMTTTAPHLVQPVPMVLPLLPEVSRLQGSVTRLGFRGGDLLRLGARTSAQVLPPARHLTRPETLQLLPGVRRAGLRGGLATWEGRLEDDVRLVVAVARTAAAHGARVVTRCRVVELRGDGADVRDELTGRTGVVRARAVVNATGVWAGQLAPDVALRPSRGTHLVLRASDLPGLSAAMTVPMPGERNRYLLVVPHAGGLVYVGLTDEPVDGPLPDVPTPTEGEIAFLLELLGSALEHPPDRTRRRRCVRGSASAARRPGPHRRPVTSARGARVAVRDRDGRRRQAHDVPEDGAGRCRHRRAAGGPGCGPCRTARLPLVGAWPQRAALPADLRMLPRRLVERHGSEAPEVAQHGESAEPVAPGVDCTPADLAWGVSHEGALDVGDLLDRRTRVGLVAADRVAAVGAARAALAAVPA